MENKQETLDMSGADTIWFRRCRSAEADASVLHPDDIKFVARSLAIYHRAFWNSISRAGTGCAFWVNDPVNATLAESKILQLMEAQRVGFRVPATLISNNRDRILDFICNSDRQIVRKSFTPFVWLGDAKTNGTAFITKEGLPSEKVVGAYPEIFQEAVSKRLEIRALFAGNQYMALGFAPTSVIREPGPDWRPLHKFGANASRRVELDDETYTCCINLLKRLGLRSGSFDLVVEDDGATTFLEVNQAGQFLWMEAAGIPVLDFFCQFLIGGREDWAYAESPGRLSLNSIRVSKEFFRVIDECEAHVKWPNDEFALTERSQEGEAHGKGAVV